MSKTMEQQASEIIDDLRADNAELEGALQGSREALASCVASENRLTAQLVDAAALHLADEQTIRNVEKRLARVLEAHADQATRGGQCGCVVSRVVNALVTDAEPEVKP